MARTTGRGYAFNQTRQTFLATDMRVANTHLTRLRGLIGTKSAVFVFGQGLWIVPCHGVHTWGMRFALDLVYLNGENVVVHVEENVKPWRFAPIRMDTATVLELPWHTVWNSGTKIGDQLEMRVERGDKDSKEKVVA